MAHGISQTPAVTRAKTDLHLIAPLKYYIASQSRMGDRHVYGTVKDIGEETRVIARLPATVRLTRGRDIAAACGQLAAAS